MSFLPLLKALNNEFSLVDRIAATSWALLIYISYPKETRQKFDYGILIALPYTKEAMQEHKNGMPQRYYTEFTAINRHSCA